MPEDKVEIDLSLKDMPVSVKVTVYGLLGVVVVIAGMLINALL